MVTGQLLTILIKTRKKLNDELFTRLIPGSNVHILKVIFNMIETMTERNPKLFSWRLLQLIQHLIVRKPSTFVVKVAHLRNDTHVYVKLNDAVLSSGFNSLKAAYLCSVLLVLFGCDVSFPNAIVPQISATSRAEDLSGAQSIDDLWHVYKQK